LWRKPKGTFATPAYLRMIKRVSNGANLNGRNAATVLPLSEADSLVRRRAKRAKKNTKAREDKENAYPKQEVDDATYCIRSFNDYKEDEEVFEVAEDCPELCQIPANVINIDIEDGLYDYAADVIVYLREQELIYQLPDNYLVGGTTKGHMRAMLVDWLIQVQHHLKLCQETLYLTVIMLDTVLVKRDIPHDKLQLVGVTCLLMASKLEEYHPADISKLIALTEDSYNYKQVLRMELVIFSLLDYQLYFPEIMPFLKRYIRAALRSQDEPFLETCQYLIDASVVDEKFSTVVPSKQAAGSILGASLLFSLQANQDTLREDIWTTTLEHYTQYKVEDILSVARTMLSWQLDPQYKGASTKYTSNSMHNRIALASHLRRKNIEDALAWVASQPESS